ncbi:anaphase-promoting complex subunit 11 RING-H2 finger-domain-containing protein [Aspergillus filifer]
MKVTLKEWNAVATWRWDMPEDEVCGICRVQFDGTCPTCKFPGDDCSLLLGKCGHSYHMPGSAMSLPNTSPSPALSSHPSKQSLNRPSSRPQSIHQVAHPADAPDEHASQHNPANIESHPHPQAIEQDDQTHRNHILPQPFFTLIEDAHTGEYYHPTVHYIFSDDDTDIVAEAALRSLETDQDNAPNTAAKGRSIRPPSSQTAGEGYDDEEGRPRKESLLPDPIPGVKDNYIILDIDHIPSQNANSQRSDNTTGPTVSSDPRGHGQGQAPGQTNPPDPTTATQQNQDTQPPPQAFSVTSSHSLSPSWQVLNTQLLPAPTFENNPSTEKPANGGLMLQIQGTSGLSLDNRGGQRLENMMEQFARRMEELRGVIECGEMGMGMGSGDQSGNQNNPGGETGPVPGVEEAVHEHGTNVPEPTTVQNLGGAATGTYNDFSRKEAFGRDQ